MSAVNHQPTTDAQAKGRVAVRRVDCDVHPGFEAPDELIDYIMEPWKSKTDMRKLIRPVYLPPHVGRQDAAPPSGGASGSDPVLLDKHLLGDAQIDYVVLIENSAGTPPDPNQNVAVRAALNRWMADKWLDKYNAHQRHKGTITIPVDSPSEAIVEIERWAGHPHFVGIRVPHYSQQPYGDEKYFRIWEAAARHRLPVCVHVNGGGVESFASPVGFFKQFFQYHAVGYPLTYGAHLTSLLVRGVFDRLPNLRFVLVEGGFTWAGPLLWRLDQLWEMRGSQGRRPSELARNHVRFTSQPIEEPEVPRQMARMFELMGGADLLMLATDYPHWDFDDPAMALQWLGGPSKDRVFCQNAIEWFNLPAQR